MHRPRAHEIDELAQQVLKSLIPSRWVCNPQQHDYGKDYLVEVVDSSGQLTGETFFVQLKGQERVRQKTNASALLFALKAKHARYYVERVRDLPVFLVLADVTARRAWWLNLQPYLEVHSQWRTQQSITVEVPIVNDLSDTRAFYVDVQFARRLIRQRHPQSIVDAISGHKERIREIDPRFDVRVTLDNEVPTFNLLAREAVQLKVSVKGPNARHTFDNLFGKGEPVTFAPGQIDISGSELFREFAEQGGTIQARISQKASLLIVCSDAVGERLVDLPPFSGEFEGGQTELRFESQLPNSPVSVTCGPFGAGRTTGALTLKWNLEQWHGQQLLRLAYFEQLLQFATTWSRVASARVEFSKDGNYLAGAEIRLPANWDVATFAEYMELVDRARKLATHFGLDPVFSKSVIFEAADSIDELYDVFVGSGWTAPRPNVRITADCAAKTFDWSAAKKAKKPGHVRLEAKCKSTLFGTEIDLGLLVIELTDATLQVRAGNNEPSGQSKEARSHGSRRKKRVQRAVPIEIRGTAATQLSVFRNPVNGDEGSATK